MGPNDSFEFTYSAPEQEEIRRIREKYLPPQEHQSKLERLREEAQKEEEQARREKDGLVRKLFL